MCPNKEKNDLGLVVSDVLCDTAAVYTSNKVKGAPILVTKSNLAKTGMKSKAIILKNRCFIKFSEDMDLLFKTI